MTSSQNGWPVVEESDCDQGPFEGVVFPNGILKGDVATIARWQLRRYKRDVEPLVQGTCWGWFVKTISGSSTVSNHSSGTAWDINAPQNPQGPPTSSSMTDKQIKACRKIVDDSDGTLRWGGDYSGTPDPMHWEIDDDAAAVSAFADRIRAEQEDDVTPAELEAAVLKVLRSDEGKLALGLGADHGLEKQVPGGAAETYAMMIKHTHDNVDRILEIVQTPPPPAG